MTHVTAAPWGVNLQHSQYGTLETYSRAAAWFKDCAEVSDWGGGSGFFRQFLPDAVRYRLVDGTLQADAQTIANLETFAEPAEGILIRHVLEHNVNWLDILQNAMRAFTKRLVVVTFTGPADATHVVKMKSGWPVHQFNLDELRHEMAPCLVRDEAVSTSHPEHVFYLAKGRA